MLRAETVTISTICCGKTQDATVQRHVRTLVAVARMIVATTASTASQSSRTSFIFRGHRARLLGADGSS
ncbi:hypothetical protein BKN51_03295 [Amycolatopsis sp. BJA-103]|nr:hypothetical protein BKN51_03295 [Amycolatopsis sp. BJA-103]